MHANTFSCHQFSIVCWLELFACFKAGDKTRDFSFEQLLDSSLPFAEISCEGEICVAKADGSGGVLNYSTCAQQLLYEVGDPGSYNTPDVVS